MTAPKLRFPEFVESWRPVKAGKAFSSRRTRGQEGLPIYSVTQDRGMVRRDSLDRQILEDAEDGVNLRANTGDLVYNMMRMWQGAVGQAPETCMVSPAYVVLAAKAETCPEFFKHWFKSKRMLHMLWAYSQGLTNDRLRLYFNDFSQIPLHLPSRQEQEKIARFLTAIDEKVSLLSKQIYSLEQYKKGVMFKIFSGDLRFKSNTGENNSGWEEVRLTSIGSTFNGLSGKSALDFGSGKKYITYKQVFDDNKIDPSRFEYVQVSPEERQSRVMFGDVLFTVSSETPLEVGLSSVLLFETKEDIYLNSFCFGFRIKSFDVLSPQFARYLFRSHVFRSSVRILAQGSTRFNMSKMEFSKLMVRLPALQEQLKIAEFLSELDEKIAKAKRKLEAIKLFKQGLLQQMFV